MTWPLPTAAAVFPYQPLPPLLLLPPRGLETCPTQSGSQLCHGFSLLLLLLLSPVNSLCHRLLPPHGEHALLDPVTGQLDVHVLMKQLVVLDLRPVQLIA